VKATAQALETLATIVHRELRDMARRLLANEARDRRWQPKEPNQESYLRLLDWRAVRGENRAHFFATVARMMRRILVDAARHRCASKRGHGLDIVPLEEAEAAPSPHDVDLIALEDALARLESLNPRATSVIELRFFGGFTVFLLAGWTYRCLPVSLRSCWKKIQPHGLRHQPMFSPCWRRSRR
jgi:RNA polymerase sigma factor (TIGR02999 family)